MSVIVKGMKMPENCETCEYQTKGACFASGVNKGTITIRRMDKERPDWCPLAELPPKHGRLIDADALMDIFADRLAKVSVRYGIDSAVAGAVSGAMKLLDVQPTVVEAEDEG